MNCKKLSTLFLLIIFGFFSQNTFAEGNRGVNPVQIKLDGKLEPLYNKSFALVIGNSNYTDGWSDLPGVKADVQKLSQALKNNGFHVIVSENLKSDELKKAFSSFIKNQRLGLLHQSHLFLSGGHLHVH